jgi:hypothetical protein
LVTGLGSELELELASGQGAVSSQGQSKAGGYN